MENKELNFEEMINLVDVEAVKIKYKNEMKEVATTRKNLTRQTLGFGYDKMEEAMDKRLTEMTMEEFDSKINTKEFVESFFVDGNGNTINFDNGNLKDGVDDFKFKQQFLTYVKSTMEYENNIDHELEKLNEETEKLNTEIKEACDMLNDNILTYIAYMREKAETMEQPQKGKILKYMNFIESAYTFDEVKKVIDRYNTIPANTLKEFTNPVRSKDIIKNYERKVKTHKTTPVLTALYKMMSFEKKFLKPSQYEPEMEGLFLFTLIRYFSMSNFNDCDKKMHSAMCVTFKNLYEGKLADSSQELVLKNAAEYLELYK